MGKIRFKSSGDLRETFRFLNNADQKKLVSKDLLNQYGELGLEELQKATPVDSGKTRDSWSYYTFLNDKAAGIVWSNDNLTSEGVPLVVLLHHGHGTKNGGYVPGNPFIPNAIDPVLTELDNNVWDAIRHNTVPTGPDAKIIKMKRKNKEVDEIK